MKIIAKIKVMTEVTGECAYNPDSSLKDPWTYFIEKATDKLNRKELPTKSVELVSLDFIR